MTYRFSMKKSPRSIIVVFIAFLLGFGGFVSILFLTFPWNVLLAAVCIFLSVFFGKTASKQKKSKIITHDDGISGLTGFGEKISLNWNTISHQGLWYTKPRILFLYSEQEDQLLIIPDEYTQFDELIIEIKHRFNLQELMANEISSIKDYLNRTIETSE
jgi:hypothetical protein